MCIMSTPEMISEMASELVRALEVTMDPFATQVLRQEAYNAYERFKECSPFAAQVGLFLIQTDNAQDYIVHFGLQLMEHCVKYRWNQLSQQEKLFIKENTMRLLMSGTQREPHIKDALSRIIVEMVKREWPQQWPTLLAELNVASNQGATQAEVVLLVLLRLCEDVAVLQTLESTSRRKDLYQAMNSKMGEMITFILQRITLHFDLYRNLINSNLANSHARVVQTGLTTLSSFVEWVSLVHITADNNMALAVPCMLLEQLDFQNNAVECLYQIVSRKGQIEERKFLLEWFDVNAMGVMLRAADAASRKSLEENNYLFLKKLTQVLTGLGNHICFLWGKDDTVSVVAHPEHLDVYLNVMLTFARHPSLTMVNYANILWSSFFKHPHISRHPVFQKYIPQWVETSAPKIIKVAYPASRIPTTDQDAATILDFDSEEEFTAFFMKTRNELLETFKRATDVAPHVTYTYVENWSRTVLQQSVAEAAVINENHFCTLQSPLYLQWEALSQLLDKVVNRLVHLDNTLRPSISSGLELLELCLNYNPVDPLLLSVLLSCISALFVFLSMATAEQSLTILPRVLDKIFAVAIYSLPGQTKVNRSRAVKNVRRHAGAMLVKIGQRYPLILLPLFDQINVTVHNLNKEQQLSKMEQVTLEEALVLICNHFNDYNKQSEFVGNVLRPGVEQWLLMGEGFRNAKSFMSYVGLNKPPSEPSSEDVDGQNRSHIAFCTDLFYSVILRSTWPEDPDRAARGGFVVARTGTGNPIYRNPASPHIIPALPNVLSLIGVLNSLWEPESISLLSEGYKNALQMLEVVKVNWLGTSPNSNINNELDMRSGNKSPLERMQRFLHTVYENCCHILGNAGPRLGRDFYDIPQLGPALITTVFSHLENLPDYRLRPLIRTFLRPFVSSCPKTHYEQVLLPVLTVFMPYMLARLASKWEYLTQLRNENKVDDEATDTQEVVEDKLISLITREYTEIIKTCLVGGNNDTSNIGSQDDVMEQDEGIDVGSTHRGSNQMLTEVINDLGVLLLRTESTSQVTVLTLLRLLTWSDSVASLKSVTLLHSVVRQLAADDALNEPIVGFIMTSVLQALQIHGQYDANQGALLAIGAQLFEMLRPKFSVVSEVMIQIPNINRQDLHKLEEKIHINSQNNKITGKVDKTTKDLFRKITQSLIGRNISQLFKKEVKIIDLPKLTMSARKKNNLDTLTEKNYIGSLHAS